MASVTHHSPPRFPWPMLRMSLRSLIVHDRAWLQVTAMCLVHEVVTDVQTLEAITLQKQVCKNMSLTNLQSHCCLFTVHPPPSIQELALDLKELGWIQPQLHVSVELRTGKADGTRPVYDIRILEAQCTDLPAMVWAAFLETIFLLCIPPAAVPLVSLLQTHIRVPSILQPFHLPFFLLN